MQYILIEEEYKALKQKPLDIKKEADKIIADLCQVVADWQTIENPYYPEDGLEPHCCIRSVSYEHCCGRCPVKDICTYNHKEWSQ
jgi:hypothetical protein